MAVQEQTLTQATESLCPPIAPGQSNSIQTGAEAMKRDDCPNRTGSFMERFLDNLRLALAVPHT